ncbi:MAG: hypothetical protein RLZ55_1406, partial [Actinomycetota bacterium]
PYSYAHQIDSLARLGLDDDWLRAVLWRNGARLLGLTAPLDPVCAADERLRHK